MCIAKRKDWQSRSCCSRICCHPQPASFTIRLHHLPSEHLLYSFLQRARLIPQFPVCLFYTQPAETGTWCLFVHLLRGDGTDERAIQPQYVRYPISDVCNGQALAATEVVDAVLWVIYQLLHSLRHVSHEGGRTPLVGSLFLNLFATSWSTFPCCPGRAAPYTTTTRTMA